MKHIQNSIIILAYALIFIFMSCRKEPPTAIALNSTNYQIPIANAGDDKKIKFPLDSVFLDGSLSYDPDNKIKKYQWSKVGGPVSHSIRNPENINTWITSLVKGDYFFELRIIDINDRNSRDTVRINVEGPDITASCANRPESNATLVPLGNLSLARATLQAGTAGSKILFAAGWYGTTHSSRVDIYDTITHTWSTAELTEPLRDGMTVASVGPKILFAGGGDDDWIDVVSRVDMYDASNNTWSVAELSRARNYLSSATIGNKVFFAGGGIWGPLTTGSTQLFHIGSTVVDIYDNATNSWTTSTLSEGRFELSATTAGNKIFFAGGLKSIYTVSDKIDVYDASFGAWSESNLQELKTGQASVAFDNKIMWAGGANTGFWYGYNLTNLVEIRDVNTGAQTFDCISLNAHFKCVRKNDNLVFFTGNISNFNKFDVYNITTNTWRIGVLPFSIRGAAIISVNNTIYIAGGWVDGVASSQVWKLEF